MGLRRHGRSGKCVVFGVEISRVGLSVRRTMSAASGIQELRNYSGDPAAQENFGRHGFWRRKSQEAFPGLA